MRTPELDFACLSVSVSACVCGMCVYVFMYVMLRVQVCDHQRLMLILSFCYSPSCILRGVLSLNLELANLARPICHGSSEIHLSSHQLQDDRHTLLTRPGFQFYGFEFRSLCSPYKHFIDELASQFPSSFSFFSFSSSFSSSSFLNNAL